MRTDFEVLVIGSGAAGLAAALSARDHGAERVAVAESESQPGGSSRLSGGMLMGAGTEAQRRAGIEDTPEELFHEYLALNQWQVDAATVLNFCRESGATIDWLAAIGVPFLPHLVKGGDERKPRTHLVDGAGQGLVDAMLRAGSARDIDVVLGRKVERLVLEEGAVVGVGVGGEEVRAAATVLASGGFGASPEKLCRHYPSAAATGTWAWYIGASGARGDALDMGAEMGLQVTGHDRGLRLPHPGFVNTLESYLPAWMVVVDAAGRRRYDESAPYGVVDGMLSAVGVRAFVVFDDRALRWSGPRRQYKDPVMDSRLRTPNWTPAMVDEQVERYAMTKADSLEALVVAAGIAPRLATTIDRYNAFARGGRDEEYAKHPDFLQALETPPFYAAEIRPATICLTAYGLRTDPHAAVLDDGGFPVPGLFAAGECTGGIVGARYMGSGNSLGNATTMGRIAGRSAAARSVNLPTGVR